MSNCANNTLIDLDTAGDSGTPTPTMDLTNVIKSFRKTIRNDYEKVPLLNGDDNRSEVEFIDEQSLEDGFQRMSCVSSTTDKIYESSRPCVQSYMQDKRPTFSSHLVYAMLGIGLTQYVMIDETCKMMIDDNNDNITNCFVNGSTTGEFMIKYPIPGVAGLALSLLLLIALLVSFRFLKVSTRIKVTWRDITKIQLTTLHVSMLICTLLIFKGHPATVGEAVKVIGGNIMTLCTVLMLMSNLEKYAMYNMAFMMLVKWSMQEVYLIMCRETFVSRQQRYSSHFELPTTIQCSLVWALCVNMCNIGLITISMI